MVNQNYKLYVGKMGCSFTPKVGCPKTSDLRSICVSQIILRSSRDVYRNRFKIPIWKNWESIGQQPTFFKFSPLTNTRGHPYKLYKSLLS